MILLRLLITFLVLARAVGASACSMSPEWVKPSNFELVEMSEAIVVATPLGMRGNKIRWRVTETLHGTPPKEFELFGRLSKVEPSSQSDFMRAHPSAYAGSCSRHSYAPNRPILAMLDRRSGEWTGVRQSFSRDTEDYGGPASPWTKLVRKYLDLKSSRGPLERHRALREMVRTGVDHHGEKLEAAEIADIRNHLSSLSPYKPSALLLDAYASLEQGRPISDGIRSRDADREGGAAEALTNLVFGDRLQPSNTTVQARMLHVLRALVNGHHVGSSRVDLQACKLEYSIVSPK